MARRRRLEDSDAQALLDAHAKLVAAEERSDRWMMRAHTDALTGLLNFAGFEQRTDPLDWGWFVGVDLDHFKTEQDEKGRGHEWGNIVLKEFGDFLMGLVREREFRAGMVLVSRTGGDEFAIWTETRSGAKRMRDRIREWNSEHGGVSASAGLGDSKAAADAAMYFNKQERKEAVCKTK